MSIGKDQYFSWDYSEKSDILNIHKTGKQTAGSAELGDFTVDFDKNGNIVGVEVMNALDFFLQVGISGDDLAKIHAAELIIKQKAQYSMILVKLVLPQNVERVVPIPTPVVAEAAA